MNCRDARLEIALRAGHDEVDLSRWEEVRRHVSSCSDCRVHYRQLKQALQALEQSEPPSTYETRDSLWPELKTRLEATRRPEPRRLRRWLPSISFAVACLLFITVWVSRPGPAPHPQGPPIPRGIGSLSEWSAGQPARGEKRDRPAVDPPDEDRSPRLHSPE